MAHRSRGAPAAILAWRYRAHGEPAAHESGQPAVDDSEASGDQRHARGLPRLDVLAEEGGAKQDRNHPPREGDQGTSGGPPAGGDAEVDHVREGRAEHGEPNHRSPGPRVREWEEPWTIHEER